MALPVRITKTLATAADDDIICLSQTPLAAGNLTLNGVGAGGVPLVATLDTGRRVILTFAGNETGHNFTIYGYNRAAGGTFQSEVIAGTTAGVVQSTLDYGVVTRVAISAAATGAIKVGTNGVGDTEWQLVDPHVTPTNLIISVDVVGTVTYSVQYTADDIMGSYAGQVFTPGYPTKIWDDPVVVSATADAEAVYSAPISAWRVSILSGTGTLRIVGTQAGLAQ